DTAESGTNSYHVAINFTAPTPNNEFVMDGERSKTCNDAPAGSATNITDYDWCVNGTGTDGMGKTIGEAPCTTTMGLNQPQCGDHSSHYFIHVHRKSSVTGTCAQYSILVTAAGGVC